MDGGPWTELGTVAWFLGRVGRDDGRDDVPLGRADRRPLLEAETHASSRRAAPLRFRVPPRVECRRARWRIRSHESAHSSSVTCSRGISAGRWVAGATLLVAAAYELTPLKNVCLGKCRTPLGFLLGSWKDGLSGATQMGARHGAWCVGCCWALMASLLALGLMSIVWMAFVAGLIAFEKLIPPRRAATYGTAAALPRDRGAHAVRSGRDPGADDPGNRIDVSDGRNEPLAQLARREWVALSAIARETLAHTATPSLDSMALFRCRDVVESLTAVTAEMEAAGHPAIRENPLLRRRR